jgi:hypothetical protein
MIKMGLLYLHSGAALGCIHGGQCVKVGYCGRQQTAACELMRRQAL